MLAVGVVAWTGCDSDSNEDDADVSGTYAVTTLSFRPDATSLPTANVLTTVTANSVSIQFFANGRFTMIYRPQGASQDFILDGSYDIDGNRVDLDFGGDFDDEREDLLLPDEITLRTTNNGTTLTAEVEDQVNLEGFGGSDAYDGLGEVRGTLQITLQRG